MELELEPSQPAEVLRAVRAYLDGGAARTVDEWWLAGIDEALAGAELPAGADQGEATARPRRTPGAARA